MRILFLTQIIPYPPDAGPKVKTWNVLRYLAELGHQITLVSFIRPEEEAHVQALWQVCSDVHTVPIHRSRVKDLGYLLLSQISGRPFLVERDDSQAMRKLVWELVAAQSIDCIHADQLTMAQFAFRSRSLKREFRKTESIQCDLPTNGKQVTIDTQSEPRLVFDAHNAVWTIVERSFPHVPQILKPLINIEAKRVKQYEGLLIQCVDVTLAVSTIDRSDLLSAYAAVNSRRQAFPPKIDVIPIAVDTTEIKPVERKADSKNILTLGTLHYPPNADGIRWFIEKVFPLITEKEEDATLTIVGKNPPEDFIRLAVKKPDQIRVTGYVPDLMPYMQAAALIVIPVRTGSGMRVRILEAFARAMPVVTTTVGIEGIDAKNCKDVVLADTQQSFSEAVVDLLRDKRRQENLAKNGRRLVEEKYDWQVVLDRLDSVYQKLQDTRSRG